MDGKIRLLSIVSLVFMITIILIFITSGEEEEEEEEFESYVEPWEDLDPSNYPSGLGYPNEAAALDNVNSQLTSMDEGSISIINDSMTGYCCTLRLLRTHGDVYIWRFITPQKSIWMDAETGEIIMYFNHTYSPGDKTQVQILNAANTIAAQFCALPTDRASEYIEQVTVDRKYIYNVSTNTWSWLNQTLWAVKYSREKNGINASDHIEIRLTTSGDLNFYYKDWYMNIWQVSTTFSISQGEAEEIACADSNASVHLAYRFILRPNGFWDSTDNSKMVWNSTPTAVWVILVQMNDIHNNHAYIYYIDGTTGDIVGGDKNEDFFDS